jgi:hypothetical protein
MNTLLRRHILVAVLVLMMMLALDACKEDQPVQQPPGNDTTKYEDTTKLAPTGMPDWSDPQYGWMLVRDSICAARDISSDYWDPKFGFHVWDASPDGRQILLQLGDRVGIYDTVSHDVRTVFPFTCEYAQWSHDGRYIAGVSNYSALQQRLALYDVTTDRWQFLSLPDSVDLIASIVSWLPGDTSFVVGILFNGEARSHSYNMTVAAPYSIAALPEPHFSLFAGTTGISVEGSGHAVRLRTGPIGDIDGMKTYSLTNGIVEATGFSRASHDGSWIAFRMDVDLTGSRFSHPSAGANSVTSLGIIDLRPGSPTQYQLYRVFPDYTNTYRNCAVGWFFSGMAWSGDGKYVYHEQVRISDSTTQIVRRNVRTGAVEPITNFLSPP